TLSRRLLRSRAASRRTSNRSSRRASPRPAARWLGSGASRSGPVATTSRSRTPTTRSASATRATASSGTEANRSSGGTSPSRWWAWLRGLLHDDAGGAFDHRVGDDRERLTPGVPVLGPPRVGGDLLHR